MTTELLPCPFCGDAGDKGRQTVTQMIEGRPQFDRITCRSCGAMCPENNWGRRIGLAALITDDQIDRIFSIYMNGFTTNADLRNAAREIIRTSIQPALAAPAPQVPSEVARCMCKDRALTDCPGEWEPGCDLGNNAEHVRVSTTDPAVIDAAVAAPAARLVGGEATIFGLDYDGTITRDPDMWHAVMKLMQSRGHEVHIVTMRHGIESTMGHAPMEQRFLDDADGVHFTGNSETRNRDAKRPHMDAKGIGVHVWIDDNPKAVHMSAREIWGWCTNPGDPMIHSAPELVATQAAPTDAPGEQPHAGSVAEAFWNGTLSERNKP